MSDEFYSIPTEGEESYTENPESSLITAIIEQAIHDGLDAKMHMERASALRFIDSKNKLFCFYCGLISVDPETIEQRFKKKFLELFVHGRKRTRNKIKAKK